MSILGSVEDMSEPQKVRIRWEVTTCYTADVPRCRVPAEVLKGLDYGVRVERLLDRIGDRGLSREVGDDGGVIVEIEQL
jgi:hypothetical protein